MALKVVNFGSGKGGLTTVGYTVYGVDGVAISSRSTDGVVEIGTSTGVYAAPVILPDYDAIILWDTGEATPRYATEDYQYQLQDIINSVLPIQKIYNSIKNQGEFLATLMDRLGLIERNEGLKKVNEKLDSLKSAPAITDIEEAFNNAAKRINLTAIAPEVKVPEVKIPEIRIPDYSSSINDIKSSLASIRGEIMKVPKTQKEYSHNFDSVIGLLNSLEQRLSQTVNTKSDEINKSVKSMQVIFQRFDSVLSKIGVLQDKLNSLDTNDKTIIQSRDEILKDIKRLNQFVYDFVSSPYMKEAKDMSGVLMAFGHKR